MFKAISKWFDNMRRRFFGRFGSGTAAVSPPPPPPPPPPPTPTSFIGINTSTIQQWGGSRPFMNLLYGSPWAMQGVSSGDIPPEYLDADGWPMDMPAGNHPGRSLSIPVTSADMIIRYTGNGPIHVVGAPVSNVVDGVGQTTFHYASSYPSIDWASVYWDVDVANHGRAIDIREVGASPTANLAPEFVTAASGYSVIRFLGWVEAVNANSPSITWATRNKPGDGDYVNADGVPVELMVELANAANSDPWFTLPWNADDTYITNFATYVRDHLAAGRKAYVENSNEVWNFGFPQATQAKNEGVSEGLPGDIGGDFQRTAERSGERTKHVMDIWSAVFAGQMNRLVRVFAWQNASPGYGEIGLGYALPSVDAYSTAVYFPFMQATDYTGQSLDTIMDTILPAKVAETLAFAAQNKAIAVAHGLQYIGYEGGQHVVLPSHLDLLRSIETDPRMYDLYVSLLQGWQALGGGVLAMTNLQGGINTAGAWGDVEWIGQPVSLATTPKQKAIDDVRNGVV